MSKFAVACFTNIAQGGEFLRIIGPFDNRAEADAYHDGYNEGAGAFGGDGCAYIFPIASKDDATEFRECISNTEAASAAYTQVAKMGVALVAPTVVDLTIEAARESFTTLKLGDGDEWRIPLGFGKKYADSLRVAREHSIVTSNELRENLEMIGYVAETHVVHAWSLRRRVEASVYADDLLKCKTPTHPRPEWMPEPWSGNLSGETPTPIYE